jgi:hypothetical protein
VAARLKGNVRQAGNELGLTMWSSLKLKADETVLLEQLVTPKHDPNNLGQMTYSSYRSISSYELASKLERFITSENYDVIEYRNLNTKHKSEELLEIIPTDSSGRAETPRKTG